MFEPLVARVDQWLFEPPPSIAGRPLAFVLRVMRFPYALVRDFVKGELTMRAMSLVYSTLLSIVPFIALSFSVLKGLGYHHDLEPLLYQFLEPLGPKAGDLTARIMGFVDNVRGGVLGSLGLVFLIYTVITTIQKIEQSFNFVWRVEQPRSFGRRFSEYLSVMVVGPALIVAALGLLATMASSRLAQDISHISFLGSFFAGMGRLMPYVLITGVFAFMYAFVPNTKVRMKAALVGGLVAGCAWAAVGAVFASFVAHSTQTMAIYASFAILVAALIWIHLCWLILLLGAQLSFYVQNPQYLRPGRSEIHLTASLRERIALSVMSLIAQRFQDGERRWTIELLGEQFDVPSASIGSVVHALEAKGILLAADDETWVPARNPEAIELFEVIDAVRNDSTGLKLGHIRSTSPAETVAREVETALRASVQGKTVRDLIDEK